MGASRGPREARRQLGRRRNGAWGCLSLALLAVVAALAAQLRSPAWAWQQVVGPVRADALAREAVSGRPLDAELQPAGRRASLARLVAKGVTPAVALAGAARAAQAEVASLASVNYEVLQPGTDGKSPRDGPPKYAARVWLKFAGHVDGFDGPVFDSSALRGARRPARNDYVEVTVGLEGGLAPAAWDVVKQMKVGEKGRFVLPPALSYGEGRTPFDADEDAKIKQVPANSTLFYEVELVRIIRP